ncbi:hypothetical protein U1Q18_005721 [Sarracenia purpurea var. burkii]
MASPEKNQRKHGEGEGRIPTEKSCMGLGRCSAKFFRSSDGNDLRGGRPEVDRRKQRRPAIKGEKNRFFA